MSQRLTDRDFAHRVSLVCVDPRWESAQIAATDPLPPTGPFSGFVRREDEGGVHYAYFGGRSAWSEGDAHVTEGYLFAVSARHSRAPNRYPSDGGEYRAIGEAMVTDDATLLPRLRKAYGR